jgi:hypothetical protein
LIDAKPEPAGTGPDNQPRSHLADDDIRAVGQSTLRFSLALLR